MQNAKMKRRFTRLAMAAAWIAVIAIAYATLTRVGFVYAIYFKLSPYLLGPGMQTYAHFEHVIAFAILGMLFGVAYPGRTFLVCSIVVGGAALLEILQTVTPDRHGTLLDALEKMTGGAAGIALAKGIVRLISRNRQAGREPKPGY